MSGRLIAALLALVCAPSVASAQTEQIEYYGLDALGSVRVIFDAQGNTVDRMDYGPFGENLRAAIKFPVEQFAQLARNAESNDDYGVARNYVAPIGRFNAIDPVYAGLFEPQKWNRYAYARNNPLTFVDPSGLEDVVEVPCPEGIQGPCFSTSVTVTPTMQGDSIESWWETGPDPIPWTVELRSLSPLSFLLHTE